MKPRAPREIERDAVDQWVMIRACSKDKQWLWLLLALDQHIKTVQEWKRAIERQILS